MRCNLSILFIRTCLNSEKYPKFSKVHLNGHDDLKQFVELKITTRELSKQRNKLNKIGKEKIKIRNKLFDIKPIHWTAINLVINKYLSEIKKETTIRHNDKLNELNVRSFIQVNSNFVNKSRNKIDEIEEIKDKQTVFNLSSRSLSEIELQVLNKGLKYGIKNKKINKFEILSRFEILAQSLNKFPLKPDESNLNNKNTFSKILVVTRSNLSNYAKTLKII